MQEKTSESAGMEVNMKKGNELTKRIIGIECPTDSVADRIFNVLEEYNVDGQYQITSIADDDYKETRLRYYRAFSETGNNPDIVMIVKEGKDGYVAKVVDAYTEQ